MYLFKDKNLPVKIQIYRANSLKHSSPRENRSNRIVCGGSRTVMEHYLVCATVNGFEKALEKGLSTESPMKHEVFIFRVIP